MVLLNGYPSVAKFIHINTSYSTTDNTDVHFESGTLISDSVNLIAGAGEITKGRTTLGFADTENGETPIPWGTDVPQAVKDIFASPQDALKYALDELYKSDEHQYRLGSKERPAE